MLSVPVQTQQQLSGTQVLVELLLGTVENVTVPQHAHGTQKSPTESRPVRLCLR